MDEQDTAATPPSRWRRWAAGAALVGAGLLAGGILAGSQIANAANGSASSSAASTAASGSPRAGVNPATMAHGPGETLITGAAAAKVTAAAEKAVPNAKVIRVETDAATGAYEAHMQRADGSYVTVEVNKSFQVTATKQGFGPCPNGPPGASGGSNT